MNNVNFTPEQVFEVLEQTGLNWTVSKEPLISAVDSSGTSAYGIFKQVDRTFLSSVGKVYTPYQNHQLVENILTATAGLNMPITNGGQLNNGAQVYLQAELPEVYIGKSGVKRHITATNTHGTSGCIGFGSSNTVIVCQNTFNRAYKDLQKVRHTMAAAERVQAIAEELNAALLHDNRLIDIFKEMANTPVKEDMIQKVITKMFEVDTKEAAKNISTRKKNQIISFGESLRTEFQLEGQTVWGLFNGVTRYTNHVAAPNDEQGKAEYLMVGRGFELSNMSFELLCKEIGIEKEVMV